MNEETPVQMMGCNFEGDKPGDVDRYHRQNMDRARKDSLSMPGSKKEDCWGPKTCVVHTYDVGSGALCVLWSCVFYVWCAALCDMYIPTQQLSKAKLWDW